MRVGISEIFTENLKVEDLIMFRLVSDPSVLKVARVIFTRRTV